MTDYEIRLEGHLDPRWSSWFDGLGVVDDDGSTVLRGQVADQAALHGLLRKVRDLGVPLISVTRIPDNPSQETAMTITDRPPTTTRAPMTSHRRTSLVAGVFYLVTFVSIPTLVIYGPVRAVGYVVGAGPDTGALLGGVLELIVALAGIGTAITLFPVVRRQNEGFALGFVATRVLEASMIFVGVVSLLSIVTLRQDPAGADPAALVAVGKGLAGVYGWTFLLGQTLMPALNALLLGTLMYRSGLVPRAIPAMGLAGGPLLLASVVAILFGAWDLTSVWHVVATAPIFLWELSLGVWLLVKGFTPSAPILRDAGL